MKIKQKVLAAVAAAALAVSIAGGTAPMAMAKWNSSLGAGGSSKPITYNLDSGATRTLYAGGFVSANVQSFRILPGQCIQWQNAGTGGWASRCYYGVTGWYSVMLPGGYTIAVRYR